MNDTAKRKEPFAPAVVITGPTQGIGRALAEEFARDGHTLVLVARDEQKLAATARSLAEAHGVGVRVFACDLGQPEGGADLEAALRRFGLYADILVNNAALMTAGFFQDADPAKLRQIVDLDVQAVVDLTRRFLPGMLARGKGGVLNVASVEGFMPVPYQATYAAAKAFVLSFTRALAYETMGTGVRSLGACAGGDHHGDAREGGCRVLPLCAALPGDGARGCRAHRLPRIQARQEDHRRRLVQPPERVRATLHARLRPRAIHGLALPGARCARQLANAARRERAEAGQRPGCRPNRSPATVRASPPDHQVSAFSVATGQTRRPRHPLLTILAHLHGMVPRRAKTMSEHSTTKESAAGAMAGATATGYRVSLVPGALEVSARLASNEELEILVKVLEANKGSLGKATE